MSWFCISSNDNCMIKKTNIPVTCIVVDAKVDCIDQLTSKNTVNNNMKCNTLTPQIKGIPSATNVM